MSREIRVPPQELEDWRQVFLEGGTRGLKRTGRDPTERELLRTRAKVGELTMKLELAAGLLEKGVRDLKRLLRRREP